MARSRVEREHITPASSRGTSRRGALGIALAAAIGAAGSALGRLPDVRVKRRNACHVRCGGDRRLCRLDCRDWGSAEKGCKKACNRLRDACFVRCEYKPIRFRLAR